VRDRVFDPFFSTKGVGKGLGLGLSISYNIVKDFGGDLSVVTRGRRG
jgi:two-component system, NtrC family, C4-dicarboxylate transport sensor histidine kinase DctB